MYEKNEKEWFSKCKTKTLKMFSSNYNTLCDGSKLFQKSPRFIHDEQGFTLKFSLTP